MWSRPIGRVRLIGLVEGVSFLLLLGVAMPLKYLADMPVAVKIAGWVHGGLFVALLVAVQRAGEKHGWRYKRPAQIMLAAFLPFGPFIIDGSLAREDQDGSLAREDQDGSLAREDQDGSLAREDQDGSLAREDQAASSS